MPAPQVIQEALLEINFPSGGILKWKIAEMLAERFSLTEEQREAKFKGGKDGVRVFNFHVGNVIHTLKKLGKLVEPKNGWANINPEQVGEQVRVIEQDSADGGNTTEESIEENYQKIQEELAAELLQQIKENSPTFFEELVIELLVAMGYGGSREDAEAVGRSGDGGIDGVINEDRLGLDVIYVQAKRWESNVSEPPLRDFVGALDGKGVQKGIFITTSDFNPAAKNYVERSSKRVILINGSQLAQYMIDHDVGVSTTKTYEIKRVDSDYFAENS